MLVHASIHLTVALSALVYGLPYYTTTFHFRLSPAQEKRTTVYAFAWNRRGVVGSLERGSSEVFYWEFVCFSRRPFIFSSQKILNASTLGLLKSVLVVLLLAEF